MSNRKALLFGAAACVAAFLAASAVIGSATTAAGRPGGGNYDSAGARMDARPFQCRGIMSGAGHSDAALNGMTPRRCHTL